MRPIAVVVFVNDPMRDFERGDAPKARSAPFECAQLTVMSLKQSNPGLEILHFHDSETPPLIGAHSIIKPYDEPLMIYKVGIMASLEHEMESRVAFDNVLSIDSDCLAIGNVVDPMLYMRTGDFKVGMYKRKPGEVTLLNGDERQDASETMPYNPGVLYFSKGSQIARASYYAMQQEGSKDIAHWWGDQVVYNKAIETLKIPVMPLPIEYNWTPHNRDTRYSRAKIIHFKGGDRKDWMMDGEWLKC